MENENPKELTDGLIGVIMSAVTPHKLDPPSKDDSNTRVWAKK